MKTYVAVYEPDNSLKSGQGSTTRVIAEEIIDNRWLTYQLFYRDLSTMYKQSIMGFLWIFILPLVNVAAFFMLSRSGIFNIGEVTVPYPVYAILGMAFWQVFAGGAVTCGVALANAGDMISRINFSRKSLIIAAMGRPLISFVVQYALVLVLCIAYQMPLNGSILWAPLVIIPVSCLTLGIGFVISLLSAVIKDINNMLYVLLMLMMYMTPVLYAQPKEGMMAVLTKYNLMAHFVSAGRDLFILGSITHVKEFAISTLLSLLILFLGLRIFHMTETRIAERI